MNHLVALVALGIALTAATVAGSMPHLPIHTGQYAFQLRDAEFPNRLGIALIAKIRGHHILLINESKPGVFAKGVIAEGELMWHVKTKQWIIGQTNSGCYA